MVDSLHGTGVVVTGAEAASEPHSPAGSPLRERASS